jgi:hypothetical protein
MGVGFAYVGGRWRGGDRRMFYLYVLAAWAAVVALLFPLVFGFA